jgi:hypothetical protein
MVTFDCPSCGQTRTGLRRRCYACTAFRQTLESKAKIRETLTGVKHPPERVATNSRVHMGIPSGIGERVRGKPSPQAKPVGYVRFSNGHMQIKCADGKFRYRARVMWEEANGPIPHGYLIHHVNEDPFDDRLDNFQLVTRSEHARIHSTPERQRAAQKLGVVARKQNQATREWLKELAPSS